MISVIRYVEQFRQRVGAPLTKLMIGHRVPLIEFLSIQPPHLGGGYGARAEDDWITCRPVRRTKVYVGIAGTDMRAQPIEECGPERSIRPHIIQGIK
ncbi:hypothetical protein ACFO3E_12860 [Sphingobium tyrosinilyticum]|uniref:Uncharacterized protein n=1 Tax=Sphingobium tyrosinilyticum TaxID=2715436 RepID=A0ABV9EZI6_9SPHN